MNVSRPGPGQVRQAGSGRRPGRAPWPAGHIGLSGPSSYYAWERNRGASPRTEPGSHCPGHAGHGSGADPRDHRGSRPGPG